MDRGQRVISFGEVGPGNGGQGLRDRGQRVKGLKVRWCQKVLFYPIAIIADDFQLFPISMH